MLYNIQTAETDQLFYKRKMPWTADWIIDSLLKDDINTSLLQDYKVPVILSFALMSDWTNVHLR